MKPLLPEAIEAYAAQHSAQESSHRAKLAEETFAKTDLPQMLVGNLEGSLLKLLVRALKAKRVLEIGTFTGYSALAMAEALPAGAKIITCDINPKTARIAKKFWEKSGHAKKIKFKLGPALETLKKLRGPFDLVFIDADKENYIRYWDACLPKVKKGGVLIADNVLWSGRVLKPEHPTDHAIVRFNRKVAKDRRVEAVMLTIRDGVTVAVKK